MADTSSTATNGNNASNITNILSAMQNGVIALNNLYKSMQTVSTTSSGITTIHLTHVSS